MASRERVSHSEQACECRLVRWPRPQRAVTTPINAVEEFDVHQRFVGGISCMPGGIGGDFLEVFEHADAFSAR